MAAKSGGGVGSTSGGAAVAGAAGGGATGATDGAAGADTGADILRKCVSLNGTMTRFGSPSGPADALAAKAPVCAGDGEGS